MIGYRIWGVLYRIKRRSFILYSPVTLHPWEKSMEAVCEEGNLEEHLRRMEHTCGLYSYKSLNILLEEHREALIQDPIDILVVGTVFNYGIVAEYSDGFRSSHSLIDTIFLLEYDCYECHHEVERPGIKKGEFIMASPLLPWKLIPLCLNHLPEPLETPEWKTFPIEALRIELERYYQVPVRSLKELIGGR